MFRVYATVVLPAVLQYYVAEHEKSTFDEVDERLSHDHLYYLLFCSEFEYAIHFPNRRVQAIFALIKEAENH